MLKFIPKMRLIALQASIAWQAMPTFFHTKRDTSAVDPLLCKLNSLEHGKPGEKGDENNSQTVGTSNFESSSSSFGVVALVLGASWSISVDGASRVSLASLGLDCWGIVESRRVLRTAWVLLTTVGGASIVDTTLLDALVTPFLANIVGHGQGEFADIWLLVVAAQTSVSEGFL